MIAITHNSYPLKCLAPRQMLSGAAGEGLERVLWVDPPDLGRLGDAGDGQEVGACAHIDFSLIGDIQNVVEALRHDLAELQVDLILTPEEGLQVLHPFEVGDGHPAGVS